MRNQAIHNALLVAKATDKRRRVELVVLSDMHLGTYGCHAKELLCYLKSIKPKTLVLNGDIIDIWQFSKRYWPRSHMKVVKELMGFIGRSTKVYYITGNHDEMLRRFTGHKMGSLRLENKVLLELSDGKQAWIFHGDVFDITMQHSRWLAKAGAVGYDTLILINRFANFVSERVFRKGRLSFSKRIKDSVKSAVKFINEFEKTAADIGIANGYDYVVCGHIHQPEIRTITTEKGSILYLNSGDWIENLTALEFNEGAWRLYEYHKDERVSEDEDTEGEDQDTSELFNEMLEEFKLMKTE
jgi:UDP-2,3-diacylglucosamine pyrophosphatase LpxH